MRTLSIIYMETHPYMRVHYLAISLISASTLGRFAPCTAEDGLYHVRGNRPTPNARAGLGLGGTAFWDRARLLPQPPGTVARYSTVPLPGGAGAGQCNTLVYGLRLTACRLACPVPTYLFVFQASVSVCVCAMHTSVAECSACFPV